jgi:Family of unknown function (DUF6527)
VCGCGVEVVTPISPTDWRITFDGETVSLFPSIGNWSFPCRSHYWIKGGKVIWEEDWSDEEIRHARDRDRLRKWQYYSSRKNERQPEGATATLHKQGKGKILTTFWNRLTRFLDR